MQSGTINIFKRYGLYSVSIILLLASPIFAQLNVTFDKSSTRIKFSTDKLAQVTPVWLHDNRLPADDGIFVLTPESHVPRFAGRLSELTAGLTAQGYRIHRQNDKTLLVAALDETGAMYGVQDVAEQLRDQGAFNQIAERAVNPAVAFRAIKFNLPWSPYRPGPATDLHWRTCRDLKFWESFLDMMAENRFNALTLWNTHPFTWMIKPTNFPLATPLSDAELADWQQFWHSLFKMAQERGIETYLVNWNIVVSPEFAQAYGAQEHNDLSDQVKRYTRECVTQVINEYPELTGLGVTLADWMGNWGDQKMTPVEREAWIEDTFVKGMHDADHPIKFIHRAVLAGDPAEMRQVIDAAGLPDKTIVEVKFNWSHGHSTPQLSLTHANDAGSIMRGFWDPMPENYFIAWTIRNEDFFVLRWGNPEFIRRHIALNNHDYVDGYFIGSEGYIPANDYSQIGNSPQQTWHYAFEKQWLFYKLWGRLTYDPQLPDRFFAGAFEDKYGQSTGNDMLTAMSLVSTVPLKIASFYQGTWDFTLYSEGFLAPWPNGFDDNISPFISVDELIAHPTLDHQLVNILDYVNMLINNQDIGGKTTPLELADEIANNCHRARELISTLQERTQVADNAYYSELEDMVVWANLGLYFAEKIRGGVSLALYRQTGREADRTVSIARLERGVDYWREIIHHTNDRYLEMPLVIMGNPEQRWPDFKGFHWRNYLSQAERDVEIARTAVPSGQ